jgi:transposase-like protein
MNGLIGQFHQTGYDRWEVKNGPQKADYRSMGSYAHNWVHKADLQPESGRSPDHVAVDETVIRLNDEQYWLYAAVDPEANESTVAR